MTRTKLILAALALGFGGLSAGAASADVAPQGAHPRLAAINARLAHQNLRIGHALRAGLISPARAHALHREVHSIRAQEKAFAMAQNGALSRFQARLLNHEENEVSREIGH